MKTSGSFKNGHKINLGKKRPDWVKEKISNSHKGIKPWNKNKKGFKHTTESKIKMSEKMKGRTAWNKDKNMSDDQKLKLSKIRKGKFNGSDNYNWKGGKSFEIYPVDWTETLRISIRERDHYFCQLCGKKQGDKALDVHHIDYNKENCDPKNLISLCHVCHVKTNGKRDYWINYFKNGK